MSNAIFGTPIFSDPTATFIPSFSGGSWSGTLPLTNLADRRLAKVARSSSATLADTRFAVDLKAARRVGVIAIPKSTLSTAAKVRVLGATEMLFDYEAGDDVVAKGGTFARASTATYVDQDGTVRTAASGAIRDSHFIDGVRHTLLETSRANVLLRSQELDNAAWTKRGSVTVTANAYPAPDGTVTAEGILGIDAAVTGDFFQTVSGLAASSRYEPSFHILGPGTAVTLGVQNPAGVGRWLLNLALLSSRWERITRSHPAVTVVNEFVSTAGGQCGIHVFKDSGTGGPTSAYFWGAQLELGLYSTSYIPTTTVAVTRAADALSFPFAPLPQAMTVQAHFVNGGAGYDGGDGHVFAIANAAEAAPRFTLYNNGTLNGQVYAQWHDGASVVNVVGPVTSLGAAIKSRAVLSAAGVVTLGTAVNGGVESVAGPTAGPALTAAFSTPTVIQLHPSGAFRSLRVMAGVQSMATMDASVYDSGWLDAWPVVYPAGSLPSDDARLVTGTYTAEEAALLGSIPFTHVPATPFTARYWSVQISDAANVAGYVDLARLVLAGSYQPSINLSYGHRLALTSATVRTETDGGAAIYNDKPRRREQTFTIDQLPDDEALVSVYDMLLRIGTSGQLYFVFDAADTAHMHRRAMLCVLKELSALEFPYHRRYAIPFALIEEL